MKKISSIVKDVDHCFVCGCQPVEIHHVYFGKNRKVSDRLKAVLPLCNDHHTGAHGVHSKNGHELDVELKQYAQRELLKTMTMEEFIEAFGKSYI